MKIERPIGAVFRPGAVSGEPVLWLVDGRNIPVCEVPEADARSLLFELAELFGKSICDHGAVSEVAE
ncbi:hypothetical protein [Streptomyces sp. NBC_00354]|uniref:hypothetical protein n=1 Tax=Streptomyces sp. NBC_00354 TaxID=2975723 RepID=UPI002E26010A